jgi:hypothetical protein
VADREQKEREAGLAFSDVLRERLAAERRGLLERFAVREDAELAEAPPKQGVGDEG